MSPAAKAREAVNGRTTTSARTSSRARLIDRRGGPRYGPPASSSEGGYAPLGLPRPALGRAPAEPWRASGFVPRVSPLDFQILEGRRVGEARNEVGPAHLDAGSDAPDERQVVDGHVHDVLGHDRLHPVHERLALLRVQLAGLAGEEVVHLGQRAVRVD